VAGPAATDRDARNGAWRPPVRLASILLPQHRLSRLTLAATRCAHHVFKNVGPYAAFLKLYRVDMTEAAESIPIAMRQLQPVLYPRPENGARAIASDVDAICGVPSTAASAKRARIDQ